MVVRGGCGVDGDTHQAGYDGAPYGSNCRYSLRARAIVGSTPASPRFSQENKEVPTADQVMKQLRNDCTDEELGTMKFSVQRLLAAIDRAKKANKPARIFEVANELKG